MGIAELKSPVPTDVEISQDATLKEISAVADEAGLLPSEIETHGATKAKVSLKVLERLKDTVDGNYGELDVCLFAGVRSLCGLKWWWRGSRQLRWEKERAPPLSACRRRWEHI